MSAQIAQKVKECPECSKEFRKPYEPLLPSELPQYPWQKVGTDLFHFKDKEYLLVVDYFSRYIEIARLTNTTSIFALKKIFSRHGIPEQVRSDDGPQYASQEFRDFASSYNFKHSTSSPHHPQSNRLAERTIKTVKKMMLKSEDPFCSYRSTLLPWCNLSPGDGTPVTIRHSSDYISVHSRLEVPTPISENG